MNFLLVAFGWSILLTEVTLARPNSFNSKQSVQNKKGKKKGTGSVPAENKCNIVVNGDYYAGGPNKEIKTILQGLQAQLSEMQEQLRERKTGEGNKTGTAGDSFSYQRGGPFSTKDQDNDPDSRHCAVTFKGGWWYTTCRQTNLNGLYHHGPYSRSSKTGINWYHWKGDYYSAKSSEMKIRPADYL